MKAVLLRQSGSGQGDLFDFEQLEATRELEVTWTDMAERAKKNRTIFAQRSLHPEDVLPEWQRMQAALGNTQDVERFVSRALERLGAALHPRPGGGADAPLSALSEPLRDRLAAQEIDSHLAVAFHQPPAPGCRSIHRSHPLVSTLADELLERALAGTHTDGQQLAQLGRTGVWRSTGVEVITTIVLLRLRHQLTLERRNHQHILLVEEVLPLAWQGRHEPDTITGKPVLDWLAAPASGNLPDTVRQREIANALQATAQRQDTLDALAAQQAQRLLNDHRRVRDAADARGSYSVEALKPVDVVAVYTLLPGGNP